MISLALIAVLSSSPALSPAEQKAASMNGKYEKLLRVLTLPDDRAQYGEVYDWGWWGGTEYRGHENLPPGYWVWVEPRWYIWQRQTGAKLWHGN